MRDTPRTPRARVRSPTLAVGITLYSPALEPTPPITPPASTAATSDIPEPAKVPSLSPRASAFPRRIAPTPLDSPPRKTLRLLAAISDMATNPLHVSLHCTRPYPAPQRAAPIQRTLHGAVQTYRVPVLSILALESSRSLSRSVTISSYADERTPPPSTAHPSTTPNSTRPPSPVSPALPATRSPRAPPGTMKHGRPTTTPARPSAQRTHVLNRWLGGEESGYRGITGLPPLGSPTASHPRLGKR